MSDPSAPPPPPPPAGSPTPVLVDSGAGAAPGPGHPTKEQEWNNKCKAMAEQVAEAFLKGLPQAVNFPFDAMAIRRGEHWRLKPEESTYLASCAYPLAKLYAEVWVAEYARFAPWLLLAWGTVQVCAPRVAEDRRLAMEKANPPPPKPAEPEPEPPKRGRPRKDTRK